MNLNKYIILIVVLPLFAIAQKPKQKVGYHYSYNFPTLKITSTKLGFVIDEKSVPTSVVVKEGKSKRYLSEGIIEANTTIPVFILDNLALRTLKLVPKNEAEIILTLSAVPPSFIISSTEKRGGTPTEPVINHESSLEYKCGIAIHIQDSKDNVLYNDIVSSKSLLLTLKGHSSSIAAIKNMEDTFLSNVGQYNELATNAFLNECLSKTVQSIKEIIDVSLNKEKFFLYTFGKKKGFELDQINESVEDLEEVISYKSTVETPEELKKIMLPKIEFWKNETKKYNSEDKKQVKIYWGLLANISGAYYAIGEYEKALETAQKLNSVDFRDDYSYLTELPAEKLQNKIAYFNVNGTPLKDYLNMDYSQDQNSDFIEYKNVEEGLISLNHIKTKEGYETRIKKANYLFKVFSVRSYYDELIKMSKQFTDRGDNTVGYDTKDSFFVELVNRIATQSDSLKYTDLEVFDDSDKIIVTKINNQISQIFNSIKKEMDVDTKKDKTERDVFENIDMLILLLNKNTDKTDRTLKDLDSDILSLKKNILVKNIDVLDKLPYLELLVGELTSEDKLSFREHPDLYKKVYENYKKNYATVFFDSNNLTKSLHHREVSKFRKHLKFYESIYKEDVENVGQKFKNAYNKSRVVEILMLFIK